jgi:hypothetical protein
MQPWGPINLPATLAGLFALLALAITVPPSDSAKSQAAAENDGSRSISLIPCSQPSPPADGISAPDSQASAPAPSFAAGPPSPRSPALSRICVRPTHPRRLLPLPTPRPRVPNGSQPTPVQPSPGSKLPGSLTPPQEQTRTQPFPGGAWWGPTFHAAAGPRGRGSPRGTQNTPGRPINHPSQRPNGPFQAPDARLRKIFAFAARERTSDQAPAGTMRRLLLLPGAARTVGSAAGEITVIVEIRAISMAMGGCYVRRRALGTPASGGLAIFLLAPRRAQCSSVARQQLERICQRWLPTMKQDSCGIDAIMTGAGSYGRQVWVGVTTLLRPQCGG